MCNGLIFLVGQIAPDVHACVTVHRSCPKSQTAVQQLEESNGRARLMLGMKVAAGCACRLVVKIRSVRDMCPLISD